MSFRGVAEESKTPALTPLKIFRACSPQLLTPRVTHAFTMSFRGIAKEPIRSYVIPTPHLCHSDQPPCHSEA